MNFGFKSGMRPELKELVREASEALARLDADRLEELAHCCRALNREQNRERNSGEASRVDTQRDIEQKADLARQAREAAGEFVVFTRVLEATRANLDVMTRLRDELNRGRYGEPLEYGTTQMRARHWALPEAIDGNN